MKRIKIFILFLIILMIHCQRIQKLFLHTQMINIYSGNVEIQEIAPLKMQDGSWLLVFSIIEDSTNMRGQIVMTRSKSIQGPWSKPEPVLQTDGIYRNPKITQFKNGMIWILFETGKTGNPVSWRTSGAAFIRSYDYGDRFTVPHMIYLSGIHSWQPLHTVFELSDGLWMLPVLYQSESGIEQTGFVISDDEGESWSEIKPMFSINPDMKVQNLNINQLQDGRLLAIMQMAGQDMIYMSISDTDYMSWSDARPVNIYGSNPEILQRQSGTVFCRYRDRWPSGFSLMRSYDFGRTFESEMPLELGEEISVPAMVEYDDKQIAIFYVQSNNIFVKIKNTDIIPVISGLSVASDSVSAKLHWNPVSNVSYYRIYRGLGPDSLIQDLSFHATEIQTQYTDSLIQRGATYLYQVSAVQGSGRLYSNSGSEGPLSERVDVLIP